MRNAKWLAVRYTSGAWPTTVSARPTLIHRSWIKHASRGNCKQFLSKPPQSRFDAKESTPLIWENSPRCPTDVFWYRTMSHSLLPSVITIGTDTTNNMVNGVVVQGDHLTLLYAISWSRPNLSYIFVSIIHSWEDQTRSSSHFDWLADEKMSRRTPAINDHFASLSSNTYNPSKFRFLTSDSNFAILRFTICDIQKLFLERNLEVTHNE